MDETSPALVDRDGSAFREYSLVNFHPTLNKKVIEAKTLVGGNNRTKDTIVDFVTRASQELDRIAIGASGQEEIYSSPDNEIRFSLGITVWKKPEDVNSIYSECLDELANKLSDGILDLERFAKGVYFLEVLTHKYKNGNGRVARGLKLIIDKVDRDGEVTEDEARTVLGIGRKGIVQTGEYTFKINFSLDQENLILGVAYFGISKGLSQDEVVRDLKLNGVMPERGLELMAKRLGVTMQSLKAEFIHFMVIDSDLNWCKFSQ